jgi:hypothetical protein
MLSTRGMNNAGNLPISESAARRVQRATKRPRGRPRKITTAANGAAATREPAAVGTLTRTKSLLLAALRVWELKQRIGG